ncbi:MAG: hypothetical protein RL021_852 [Bacteroidota bacterium]
MALVVSPIHSPDMCRSPMFSADSPNEFFAKNALFFRIFKGNAFDGLPKKG